MKFEEMKIIAPMLKAIKAVGYTEPTAIQEKAIPVILEGRDLIGCAQTGTGKTAAFSIPVLQVLYNEPRKIVEARSIKALILTPTRELAAQINDSLTTYGKYTGLKHTVVYGGVSQFPQTRALKAGVDILVATPGRLLDLMNQKFIDLSSIKFFVLDEADRMLDMGFMPDVRRIISKLPDKRQTLLFSATIPAEITKLADSILTEPVKLEVSPSAVTVDSIEQSVYFVDQKDKKSLLIRLLKDSDIDSALVFTRTKHGADRVVRILENEEITAQAIHATVTGPRNALRNF